tara:strand:- start:988 stop:1494 length:507 start_codon:yes stop_codon:yes gene_type:complete
MSNLKTINIKGKSYVEVSERLKYFRNNYKDYSLTTQIIECTSDQCVMVANVVDPSGRIVATGHAHETKNSSYINKTSHVENCETSAWGRALANFGIGIDSNVASANEVQMAIAQESTKTKPKGKKKMTTKIFEAMLKSISDGHPDLVKDHMHKYDMTDAQKSTLEEQL